MSKTRSQPNPERGLGVIFNRIITQLQRDRENIKQRAERLSHDNQKRREEAAQRLARFKEGYLLDLSRTKDRNR